MQQNEKEIPGHEYGSYFAKLKSMEGVRFVKHRRHIKFTKTMAMCLVAFLILTNLAFVSDSAALSNGKDQAKDWYLVLVDSDSQVADGGDSLQFAAAVVASDGEAVKNPGVLWSVEGFYDYGDLPVSAGTAISSEGLLVIADDEAVPGLTVTAKYIGDHSREYVGTAVVRLPNNEEMEELDSKEAVQEESIVAASSDAEQAGSPVSAAVAAADLPGTGSPNGYYNSVHRNPYTGALYGNDALIDEMKSSGVWGRTATNGSVTGGTNYDWTTTNSRYGSDTRYVYEGGYGNGDAMYLGTSNTGSNYRFITGEAPDAHFSIYESNGNVEAAYADIDFSIGMRLPANQSGGVVFRYQDFKNYYYLKVTPSGPAEDRIVVGKVSGGVDTVLHRSNAVANADTWYNWRIRLVGNNLRVWRHTNFRWQQRWTAAGDNVTFAAGTAIFDNVSLDADKTFAKGKAGLWAVNGGDVAFSHIAIGSLDNNYQIKGDIWTLTTGAYGNIKQLTADTLMRGDSATTAAAALRDDPNGAKLLIMGNEDVNRDEMGFNKFLGELKFAYKKGASDSLITARTGESEDIRRAVFDEEAQRVDFVYASASQNALGIKDFSVVNSYSIQKENGVEFVQYDIVVKNTSDENIEFYDIGMPVTWNNHWQGDSAYKYNLGGANNFISYHGSYIALERTEGGSQKVVFMPDQRTDAQLEYRRFQAAGSESNMPEEFFIYSKAVANRAPKAAWVNNNYSPDQSYLPNTSSGPIAPGEARKYSFRIFVTDSRNHVEIDDILVSQGSVASVVKPGMITPINQDVEMNLRTLSRITKIEDITPAPDPRNGVQKRTGVPNPLEGWYAFNGNPRAIVTFNAEKSGKVNVQNGNQEAHIYDVRFRKLGRNDIKVYYEVDGKEKWTVLQFWVTSDVAAAIQLRATYLVEKSFVSDTFYADYLAGGERRAARNAAPDSHYNTEHGRAFVERHKHAFLETNNIFGYVRGHNGDNYYCTNSVHEQCVDNIAFLANKNVNYPVFEEMKAMEQGFIDHFYTLQVRNFGSPQSTGAGSAGYEGTLWAGCGCYAGNYWGSTGTTAATSRITRGYNYQNLAAAFWSMYEATRRNPQVLGGEARWAPVDYLKVAAILAYRGMFIDNAPAGHMNDWALQGIFEGLKREAALGNEGTVAEASRGDGRVYRSTANLLSLFLTQATTRGNNFYNAAYPFSSEFAYDQTGEEGSYTLVKWFATNGNDDAAITRLDKMAFIVGKATAWTGKQPYWHHQAMGSVAGNEHWMYKYSVGHHSQILNDFFFNHADSGIHMTEGIDKYDGNTQFSQDMWRFVYPMKIAVAGWIQSGQPELHGPTGPNAANPTGGLVNKNPMADGLGILGSVFGAMRTARPYDWSLEDAYGSNYNGFPYSESAEADEGIWACLNSLSADIVPNDPNFGLAGWGAKVSDAGDAYEVIPTDGLYRKLNIVGDKFQAEFIHDRYTKAVINKDYKGMTFKIENVAGKAHTGTVNLRMLEPGTYNVLLDGILQRQVVVPDRTGDALDRFGNVNPVTFAYDASDANTQTLEICIADCEIMNLKIDDSNDVLTSVKVRAFEPAHIIVATYDDSDKLVAIETFETVKLGEQTIEVAVEFDGADKLRVFLWNKSMIPLCAAREEEFA